MMKRKKFLLLSLAIRKQQFNASAATGCVHDPGHNKLLNLALTPFPICKIGTILCQTLFIFSLFLTINLVFCLFKFQASDSCLNVCNSALQIGIIIFCGIFTWTDISKFKIRKSVQEKIGTVL